MRVTDILHLQDALVAKAKSLGSKHPEDAVQELWLKLLGIEENDGNLDSILKDDSYGYLFVMLRNAVIDEHRYDKTRENSWSKGEVEDYTEANYEEEDVAMNEVIDIMSDELDDLHWYDAKVMRDYAENDHTLRSLSDKTLIAKSSLFNTIKKVKEEIKYKVNERLTNNDN